MSRGNFDGVAEWLKIRDTCDPPAARLRLGTSRSRDNLEKFTTDAIGNDLSDRVVVAVRHLSHTLLQGFIVHVYKRLVVLFHCSGKSGITRAARISEIVKYVTYIYSRFIRTIY